VALKWKPIEQFALRGTAAKGFRAPGPAENGQAGQTFFAASTNDPILCPNPGSPTSYPNFANQCVVNLPGQQVTNPNLKPETSKSYTVGFIFEPVSSSRAARRLRCVAAALRHCCSTSPPGLPSW